MFELRRSILPGLAALLVAGCGSSGGSEGGSGDTEDFSAVLEGAVHDVIIPTYADLRDAADALHEGAQALHGAPTPENLAAAKEAWVAARVPWEQSEGFLFGPVSDLGLDPALDSWPVDHVQLNQVLASSLTLTADTLRENLGGGLKGFHTIEYLLWGDHDKTAAQLTERELEYLVAACEALSLDATTLHEAWVGEDGYGAGFVLAGSEGGLFYSQRDAVQQLINGMADICDEVANGKIADPFTAGDPMLVESQFSYNSIQDFADNLRSIENVYSGARGSVATGSLSAFVETKDAALDARVHSEIDAAIAAIYAISEDGEPFRDAITNSLKQDEIEGAQAAIRTLMNTVRGDLTSLVAN